MYLLTTNMDFTKKFSPLILLFFSQITITLSCPAQCSCTGFHVDCYGRRLKDIPSELPEVSTYIDLQNNEIETIKSSSFQNLTNLQEVLLSYNKISNLQDGAFSNLPMLTHVNLGSNILEVINKNAFQNVPNLKILELSNNKLTSVDSAFDNVSNLTRLILTRNTITALTDAALRPLTNLIYLMAAENRISHIDPISFHFLRELSFLMLNENPLKNVDHMLTKNTKLSYLDLSNCGLDSVPAGLPWATRHLLLGRNNITKIAKDTFQKTRFLGIIKLDENQIDDIQPGAFLPILHLQQISLNGNKLSKLPSFPKSVETLCMDKNALEQISSDDFPLQSKLQLLSLKSNRLRTLVPNTFERLSGLEKLYLSGNVIAELKDRTFAGLRNLTTLEIGRNPIIYIEARFAAGLLHLETLDLSFVEETEPVMNGNFFRDMLYLKSLDMSFSPFLAKNILESAEILKSLYSLETLNIMDNSLETIRTDLSRYFPNIKEVKLTNNQWHCDKYLIWLQDWIRRHRSIFEDVEDIVCSSPEILQGQAISELPMSAFFLTTITAPATTLKLDSASTEGSGENTDESGDLDFTSSPESLTSAYTSTEATEGSLNTISTNVIIELSSNISATELVTSMPVKESPTSTELSATQSSTNPFSIEVIDISTSTQELETKSAENSTQINTTNLKILHLSTSLDSNMSNESTQISLHTPESKPVATDLWTTLPTIITATKETSKSGDLFSSLSIISASKASTLSVSVSTPSTSITTATRASTSTANTSTAIASTISTPSTSTVSISTFSNSTVSISTSSTSTVRISTSSNSTVSMSTSSNSTTNTIASTTNTLKPSQRNEDSLGPETQMTKSTDKGESNYLSSRNFINTSTVELQSVTTATNQTSSKLSSAAYNKITQSPAAVPTKWISSTSLLFSSTSASQTTYTSTEMSTKDDDTTTRPTTTLMSTTATKTGAFNKASMFTSTTTSVTANSNDTGDKSSKIKSLTSLIYQQQMTTTPKLNATSTLVPTTPEGVLSGEKISTPMTLLTTTPGVNFGSTTLSNKITTLELSTKQSFNFNNHRFWKNENRVPSILEVSSNTKAIITGTSISIICLIVVVLAVALARRYRHKFKLMYRHAMSYNVHTSDTTFVLGDQDEPDVLPEIEPLVFRSTTELDLQSSRQSRGLNDDEAETSLRAFAWN